MKSWRSWSAPTSRCPIKHTRRLLGLDYGDKRIGVAVSDPGRLIASPHSVLRHKGWGPTAKAVHSLLAQLDCEAVVMGLPYDMDGTQGHQAREALGFKQALEQLGITVFLQDARLTSVEAEDSLKQGGKTWQESRALVDQVAAALILQSYLDSQGV